MFVGLKVKMESGLGSNCNERHWIFKDDSWFSQFRNGSNPWMARYAYALIFLISNLLAWAVRDYGHNAFPEMESKLLPCIASTLFIKMIYGLQIQ